MKAFWWSLIFFVLFLCSCKSKETSLKTLNNEKLELFSDRKFTFVDTTFVHRVITDKSTIKVTETLKITEYDEESGKPIKETEAKRETTQDFDKVVAESEDKVISGESAESLDLFHEANKKVEEETKTEKPCRIDLCALCVIAVLVVYLFRKLSSTSSCRS